LRFTSLLPSSSDIAVAAGKIVIEHPAEVQLYFAAPAR
jgi:hypothetical protein